MTNIQYLIDQAAIASLPRDCRERAIAAAKEQDEQQAEIAGLRAKLADARECIRVFKGGTLADEAAYLRAFAAVPDVEDKGPIYA
jgi:hypothetical protein